MSYGIVSQETQSDDTTLKTDTLNTIQYQLVVIKKRNYQVEDNNWKKKQICRSYSQHLTNV